jgi:amino-acid N-acetyltransferase
MISGLTADCVREPAVPGISLTVRKAVMSDIGPILDLINGYAARGIMLPRTEFELSENIRDFTVALHQDRLAGCGALHFYSPTMGEIRSLAVHDHAKKHGVGRRLVEALLEEARNYSLHAVFAFTYVVDFFRKSGFREVERGELPLKVWKDCLRCPKFQCCDEIAVLNVLQPEHYQAWGARPTAAEALLTPLPITKYLSTPK